MKRNCPNSNCPDFNSNQNTVKNGFYKRRDDSRKIQRYKCKTCKAKFSAATGTLSFGMHRRRVNYQLFKLLCSGVSIRRAALICNVARGTVASRVKYFGKKYRLKNEKQLLERSIKVATQVKKMQFDDLITKESSKLKPLSVTIAVDEDTRMILGAKVSQIPSFGHLAKKSIEKYGERKCHHIEGINNVFEKIKGCIQEDARIVSDKHKKYPDQVKKFFPNAIHKTYESERACVAGQGELKKVRFDPLFAINHTCAMFRANINRLFRRTWCITKDPERLQDHIDTFIYFYNNFLLKTLDFSNPDHSGYGELIKIPNKPKM